MIPVNPSFRAVDRPRNSLAGLLPADPAMLGLLAYFLTGILMNYIDLCYINSGLMFVFLFFALLKKSLSLSPLLIAYGILTLVSIINHLLISLDGEAIPEAARTMPTIFLLMLTCRACTVPGLFERAVVANTLPVAIALLLGGIGISWGRFYTEYLNECMRGILPQFAFVLGLWAIVERRFPPLLMIAFSASSLFMVLGASRTSFLYALLVAAVLFLSQRALSAKRLLAGLVALLVIGYVVLPQMTASQKRRFGEDFSWRDHIAQVVSGEASDRSTVERRGFWEIGFRAVQDRWFGYGNASFPYVVERYDHTFTMSLAANPHAGLLDALITAGYPGALLYLGLLWYLWRISRTLPKVRLCVLWLFIQVFAQATFSLRILWPLMAIAERELEWSRGAAPLAPWDGGLRRQQARL